MSYWWRVLVIWSVSSAVTTLVWAYVMSKTKWRDDPVPEQGDLPEGND